MFEYSKYKMYYIENLLPPEGSTVYRCGSLVDLCLGPHIQNTSKIKAFEIMKVGCLLGFNSYSQSNLTRTLRAISAETKMMTPCNESTV